MQRESTRAGDPIRLASPGLSLHAPPMSEEPGAEFLELQEVLAGRYSLERELGRGGMGIVYLAKEVSLDRPVALKILPPELAARPQARERFLNEARTAAKLSHPNIVPIFAVDEVNDVVLFAMAYIEGETLGERIRARGPRPPSEVARTLREVAWALAYAHAQGVIHRDVKPDNILLESGSGRALVADFGIARVAKNVEGEGQALTSGTVEFMSPEQAKGEVVGAASDMYSLGVVGYYALSGKFPFEGSTPQVILAKHISEPAPPVAAAAPGVPGRLARAIDCCLNKDPAQRFASDAELAEALSQTLPQRRELPVPLRIFVSQQGRIGAGGALLYLLILAIISGVAGEAAPLGLETLVGYGVFVGGLTIVPAGVVLNKVRRLLRAGYGPDELAVALKEEIARKREEGAFEFGHGPSLYERIVRYLCATSFVVAAGATVAMSVLAGPAGPWLYTLGLTVAFSLTTGIGTGVLALMRLERRRNIDGQLRSWFWKSRLGRGVFKLAGLGLRRVPDAGAATYRPTELAIGMAADRLYEELPREMRRALRDLPDVVRKLEIDAQRMRVRLEDLNGVVARARSERTPSRALDASPTPDDSRSMIERRQQLESDLLAARDATQQRLADAVAALETIRLSLLRMHAGSGSVESVTGDLAAARDVAEDIDRLLEAHTEIDSLLKDE